VVAVRTPGRIRHGLQRQAIGLTCSGCRHPLFELIRGQVSRKAEDDEIVDSVGALKILERVN
jgi:hypothetical protein